MDANRFDTLSRVFAKRRLSRRQALTQTTAGLATAGLVTAGIKSASAQDATPIAVPGSTEETDLLFVQSYKSGSLDPVAGKEGSWTLSLEEGLGQTIYFSNRPQRLVGTLDTPVFLEGLGFPDDNPPNAVLIFENGDGNEDITAVELFNPTYDESTAAVTYDVTWLSEYERMGITLQESPMEPADAQATFGAAHLFIDGILDCPDHDIVCYTDFNHHPTNSQVGVISNEEHHGYCRSGLSCEPCIDPPSGSGSWRAECNARFAECNGNCAAWPGCIGALEARCNDWRL